jgi:predicted O-linked N-acetylglucosamine transferase (SPINDLY family)
MRKLLIKEIEIYQKILSLYENNYLNEAEVEFISLDDSIMNHPKFIMLHAYIYRQKKEYISEVAHLLEKKEFWQKGLLYIQADLYSMLGEAYNIIGKGREAMESFLKSSLIELENNNFSQAITEYSNAIFSAAEISDFSTLEIDNLFQGFRDLLSSNITPYSPIKYNHSKINIGYLSADFRQHPVGNFLFPLIANHLQKDFYVHCYSNNKIFDDVTDKFKQENVIWHDIHSLSYEELAKQIRRDEIDILVDTGGHTANNRVAVFAYRPATIQISAIGWVGSTGLFDCDYILGDKYCTPKAENPFYTEKLISLPNSHFCYHSFYNNFPDIEPAPCLKNKYITFGCFNNFAKITDEMMILWSKILNNIPNSKLILKHKLLGCSEGQELAKYRLENAGCDLNRIELRGFSEDYLQQYNDVDIAMDTFPYVGGMTTFEALYMGVPVISRYGEQRGTRFGYSLLCNVGLEELTAATDEEFVAKAIELASNIDVIVALRENLRNMVESSPLMDEKQYTLDVENLYKEIYSLRS